MSATLAALLGVVPARRLPGRLDRRPGDADPAGAGRPGPHPGLAAGAARGDPVYGRSPAADLGLLAEVRAETTQTLELNG